MPDVAFKIPNISCGHCVNTIQNELLEMEGVNTAVGNIEKQQVVVEYVDPASEESIRKLLKEIHYPAEKV
jgi:copper chaperone CopZ